jgi:HD-GYP domain-containing protein (c-di-GMP phosphodiesterase class II)
MTESAPQFISVSDLRTGHFVYIDLGWLFHPFPLNAFKIRTQEQIDTIRALGIDQIRYSPEKSDPPAGEAPPAVLAAPVVNPVDAVRQARLETLARQRGRLKACEKQFNEASRTYRHVTEIFHSQPEEARQQGESLVRGVVDRLLGDEESSIRLLSEQVGERASLHSVNVTVISMLLGKALGLPVTEMTELGMGALFHDFGKLSLAARLRWRDEKFSHAELAAYQEHVAKGVVEGRRLGLSTGALLVIAQHHEMADGSGFPKKLQNASLTALSRVVGLVNQYDNLCNPGNPAQTMTPHEALSHLFVQHKSRFDGVVLGAFIRMMGIYPPGSVVQLTDDRFALVVSVNSNRPLKPQVVIHQPEIPREEAIIADLESNPELGIRRSLKPVQLPKAAIDYLSPRDRICYYFERARGVDEAGGVD